MLLLQLRVDSGVLQPGVSSFGYKQKPGTFHPTTTVSSERNATAPVAATTTTDFTATPNTAFTATTATTTTTTTSPAAVITTTAEGHAEPETTFATTPVVVEDESAAYATTTEPPFQQQQTDGEFQESRTDEQPPQSSTAGRLLSPVTVPPTLIQMHNQQQLHEQLRRDGHGDGADEDDRSDRDTAYAFESLEKAFATAVPLKIRSTKDLEQPKDAAAGVDQLPWSWAKDIMLQKPVLRKPSQEVV